MSSVERLLRQALKLSDEERGELAAALFRSLEPDEDEITGAEWEAAWSDELAKRMSRLDSSEDTPIESGVTLAKGAALLAACCSRP